MMDGSASIEPRPERVVGNDVHEEERYVPHHDDMMKIDSRGNARGQTEEQIREQERKVKEVVTGLWAKAAGNRQ